MNDMNDTNNMNERESGKQEDPVLREQLEEINSEQDVAPAYVWNYADQAAFEKERCRREQKKSVWTWAVGMILAFGLVLGMLAGVLLWYRFTGRDALAGDALNAGEVASIVNPSLVMIHSDNTGDTKYSYGTGFFLTSDGYIGTNYHVVEGYSRIRVTLWSAREYTATLVGYDKTADLAVLKISGGGYPVAEFGDSDQVAVGDTAIALGHPTGAAGAWSTTQGIVSALNRKTKEHPNANMIQFDASVNPGNSGGVLCNDRAQIVGIVTSRVSEVQGHSIQGINYAIPINQAMPVFRQLMEENN